MMSIQLEIRQTNIPWSHLHGPGALARWAGWAAQRLVGFHFLPHLWQLAHECFIYHIYSAHPHFLAGAILPAW